MSKLLQLKEEFDGLKQKDIARQFVDAYFKHDNGKMQSAIKRCVNGFEDALADVLDERCLDDNFDDIVNAYDQISTLTMSEIVLVVQNTMRNVSHNNMADIQDIVASDKKYCTEDGSSIVASVLYNNGANKLASEYLTYFTKYVEIVQPKEYTLKEYLHTHKKPLTLNKKTVFIGGHLAEVNMLKQYFDDSLQFVFDLSEAVRKNASFWNNIEVCWMYRKALRHALLSCIEDKLGETLENRFATNYHVMDYNYGLTTIISKIINADDADVKIVKNHI